MIGQPVVVSLQSVLGENFGLEEDIEAGEIRGEVNAARQKVFLAARSN